MQLNIIDVTTRDGKPSPNQTKRVHDVDTIVIHSTAGSTAEGAISWFYNPESNASCHYIINRAGKIFKCIPCSKRAWHAGSQSWNDRSIGIELVQLAISQKKPQQQLTKAQMASLDALLLTLIPAYDITKLVGHKEIASKSDPYTIDMDTLREKYDIGGK